MSFTREFFNSGVDPTNPAEWALFMFSLNNMLDDFVSAVQAGNAAITALQAAVPVTVQHDVSPWVGVPNTTRALNTVYQNTTKKAIFVSVSLTYAGTLGQAITDANASPATVVAETEAPASGSGTYLSPGDVAVSVSVSLKSQLFFIVLPNYYYKVLGDSFSRWVEWN
jgi:hypothetical protein